MNENDPIWQAFLSWFEEECGLGSENKELLGRAWIAGYNEGYNYAYDW